MANIKNFLESNGFKYNDNLLKFDNMENCKEQLGIKNLIKEITDNQISPQKYHLHLLTENSLAQKKGLMGVFKNEEETPIKKSGELIKSFGTVCGAKQVTSGESMKSNSTVGTKQEDRKIKISDY